MYPPAPASWKQQPTQLQAQGTHINRKQLPQSFVHRFGPCDQAPRPVSSSCNCIQYLGDASHTCNPSPEPRKECLTTAWAQRQLASHRSAHASLSPSCCRPALMAFQPPPTPQPHTHSTQHKRTQADNPKEQDKQTLIEAVDIEESLTQPRTEIPPTQPALPKVTHTQQKQKWQPGSTVALPVGPSTAGSVSWQDTGLKPDASFWHMGGLSKKQAVLRRLSRPSQRRQLTPRAAIAIKPLLPANKHTQSDLQPRAWCP